MDDLTFTQMQDWQRALQEKYLAKWGGLSPQVGREKLLWMLAEAGEAAQVLKHDGDDGVLHDAAVREHFIEEMCDVLMYCNDVLLCYGVTPQELSQIYEKKFNRNMARW